MCDNLDGRNGLNAPFCSPSTNTAVQVGRTLEITWDRRFFNNTNNNSPPPNAVFIQADFGSTFFDTSFGGLDGFTSPPLDPLQGRFTWTILDSFLTSGGAGTSSRGARLFLAQEVTQLDSNSGISTSITRITGPRVVLRARDDRTGANTMPNPLSIALPVGLGVLVVLIIGVWFCFRRWRNHNLNKQGGKMNVNGEMKQATRKGKGGFWLWKKGIGNSDMGGYGIDKRTEQRTGTRVRFGLGFGKKNKEKGDAIEIVHSTHMNAGGGAGPVRMGFVGGGSNVFREEVQRQDRGRRWDYL